MKLVFFHVRYSYRELTDLTIRSPRKSARFSAIKNEEGMNEISFAKMLHEPHTDMTQQSPDREIFWNCSCARMGLCISYT